MANVEILPTERPGEFIAEEMQARNWAQADLAFVLGWDPAQLNRLIKGNVKVTPDSALLFADAFDMPPEFFLNLQKMYDLRRAKKADPSVKTRASWASVFPVREMIKRGWIEETDASLFELQMVRFFGKDQRGEVPFVSDAPIISHAAKRSSYDSVTPIQYVWLHRVKRIGETIDCPKYSEDSLREALPSLRSHFIDCDDLKHIPSFLNRRGVRVVLVESLPGSKIDGVCLWLDGQPVIGLTNRLDRLDNLCFVLRHEIEHILRGDGREETFAPVDEFEFGTGDLDDTLPEYERLANSAAAEFCVPHDLLRSFIERKSPFISEKDMLRFAARVEINPAVVVGQIQYKTKKYNWLRKYLVDVRKYVMEWENVDGWGREALVDL